MQTRVILLVDFDYFFAQCEELRNPHLKDKPLVVCVYSGRSQDSGAVSTANYIARRFGVKSGMPMALARKRLEGAEATFLPVDHRYYEQMSEQAMSILRSFADHFEQVSVDEAFMDVSQRAVGSFENAGNLALQTKTAVKSQLNLSCSIGVGPNKLVAKIAADIQKPDGLTIVRPEQVEAFLKPLPIRSLVGVGQKTEQKMRPLGIRTIGDLAKFDPQLLREMFGKSMGIYLYNASMGMGNEPVQEKGEVESISRISTLKEDTDQLQPIIERAFQLCGEIHSDLTQRKLKFKTIGVIAVTVDLRNYTRSRTCETPTDDVTALKETVKELFEKFLSETELRVRRIGVKISNLIKEQPSQKRITNFLEPADE